MASGSLRSNDRHSWHFSEGGLDCPDVRHLLDLHFAELRGSSPPEACHVLPVDELRESAISFWTARNANGLLAAVGALKVLGSDHGEIKSMRTAPTMLRRGAGRATLRHLISVARERGLTRVSLETGSTPSFAAALALYASEGFVSCGPFGGYQDTPFTRFFTLDL